MSYNVTLDVIKGFIIIYVKKKYKFNLIQNVSKIVEA